ncbi:alpha/beta hydrolase fold domain-containing protein [Streptomyces mirabilis]|uniref:alpha/beta hydrolase fold domain-containing protein n=1 Tax=Streptomyces mirabilis TaxID=68239 RepID=UPI0036511F5E
MTTIAVLGNGRVGGNLATALTRAGHEVTVADRTPGAAPDAARTARIVINATPGAGSLDRLTALRDELSGKILVDVSNATTDGLPADLIYPGSSLAEQLQDALPETRVVKTLNTMLFPVMTAPATLTQAPTAFGLPPAVIVTAEHDPLRDQGDRYAQKLADADVPVTHLPVKGATHAFLSFTGSVQLSQDVLNQLADAVATAFND